MTAKKMSICFGLTSTKSSQTAKMTALRERATEMTYLALF
jgi:hypothetical protein